MNDKKYGKTGLLNFLLANSKNIFLELFALYIFIYPFQRYQYRYNFVIVK